MFIGERIKNGRYRTIDRRHGYPNQIVISNKPVIISQDGKSYNLPGKQFLVAAQTAAAFALLTMEDIGNHFIGLLDDGYRFLAQRADMIPTEAIVYKVASKSFCSRHPETTEGTLLDSPSVEFFYRGNQSERPIMIWQEAKETYALYDPNKPIDQATLIRLAGDPRLPKNTKQAIEMEGICLRAFTALFEEWDRLGYFMPCAKFKVGFSTVDTGRPDKPIIICGSVDSDSYSLRQNGIERPDISRQSFDNLSEITPGTLNYVLSSYAEVADACSHFDLERKSKRKVA